MKRERKHTKQTQQKEPNMTDREMIRRIRSGEPELMGELIDRYYREIYQYCRFRLGRESAAYDCTQETFLKVIRYMERYVERKKFRAYLFGIARNTCIDFMRGKSEQETGFEDADSMAAEGDFTENASRKLMVEQALAKLPQMQREAIELYYYHGFKAREIAAITGEKLPSVKSRIRQGLHRLKDILEKEGYQWKG